MIPLKFSPWLSVNSVLPAEGAEYGVTTNSYDGQKGLDGVIVDVIVGVTVKDGVGVGVGVVVNSKDELVVKLKFISAPVENLISLKKLF